MKTQLLQQVSMLDIDKQIDLTEALGDSIVNRGSVPSLRQAQKMELDRCFPGHLSNPADVIGWDEVKATALASIRQCNYP